MGETMSPAEEIARALKPRKAKAPRPSEYLSTGSTLLDLAVGGGFSQGTYHLLVGDSAAGKSWVALSALAEASISPAFKSYRLIYDAKERGARMDLERFFGPRLHQRLERKESDTIEQFYFSLDDCVEDGRPFVYVEDSETSLDSEDAVDKFREMKKAARKGKEASGSYGDGKAKKHSSYLRQLMSPLEKSGSILILISQSRDNIGFGAQFNPKTRAGGRALTFYATAEVWFSVKGAIKKHVMGRDREVGSELKVKVKKNRETGWKPSVILHHYPSFGLDDIGSCVEFLVDEKVWREAKGKVLVPDWKLEMPREELIQHIDQNDLGEELRESVVHAWRAIEEGCSITRKNKYA